jgi:hypothetical protein
MAPWRIVVLRGSGRGGRGGEEQAAAAASERAGSHAEKAAPVRGGLAAAAEGGEAEAEDAEGAQGRAGGGDQADPAGGGFGAPGVPPGEREAGLQARDLASILLASWAPVGCLTGNSAAAGSATSSKVPGDEATRWPPILPTIRKV